MSNSQSYEEVTVSSDGVRVVKRFEEDEFPVPAIAFELISERDEEVTVRLSDEVPDSVEVEDLGFHPEYGSEFWTIDDKEIAFEKSLGAQAEYTTVYGIRATGTDDIDQFLTEPVIDEVDPPLEEGDDIEDALPEDEVPEIEEESEDDTDSEENIETLELKDPNSPDEETTVTNNGTSGAASDEGDTDGSETESTVSVEGSVVSTIANEIREDQASVDDLKLLQRAIDELADRDDTSEETDGVTDARVERLQSDVADLRAYTDALEEFLEENGTGAQLIEEFESQLDQFSNDIDAMEDDVSAATETADNVDEEVSELEETINDLEESIEELEEEVTEGDIAGRMEDIESEINELRDWQEQIKSTFGG